MNQAEHFLYLFLNSTSTAFAIFSFEELRQTSSASSDVRGLSWFLLKQHCVCFTRQQRPLQQHVTYYCLTDQQFGFTLELAGTRFRKLKLWTSSPNSHRARASAWSCLSHLKVFLWTFYRNLWTELMKLLTGVLKVHVPGRWERSSGGASWSSAAWSAGVLSCLAWWCRFPLLGCWSDWQGHRPSPRGGTWHTGTLV